MSERTLEEKREEIRAVCVAANPEIVELKFGCEINMYGAPRIIVGAWPEDEEWLTVHKTDGGPMRLTKEMIQYASHARIIGRPIHFFDVVKAARKVGYNSTEEWYRTLGRLADYWNLEHDRGDDLSVKTEGTIEFIWSLLTPNSTKNV